MIGMGGGKIALPLAARILMLHHHLIAKNGGGGLCR
jgi:hypothetical protein